MFWTCENRTLVILFPGNLQFLTKYIHRSIIYTANSARQDVFLLKGMVTGSEGTPGGQGLPSGDDSVSCSTVISSSNSILPGGGMEPPHSTASRAFPKINHPHSDGRGGKILNYPVSLCSSLPPLVELETSGREGWKPLHLTPLQYFVPSE